MDNGLQVLMSPVQLAAVLSDETVTQAETLQNRLLGGLGVAMGTIEMVGAGVLCLAPEPTMLSKAGCVVVGYGFRQGIANKENIYAVRIVLLKKIYNSKPYYLLTAYPFMG